jgi:hypothetical protein
MKDNNGTRQACGGAKVAAAGLLTFLAACASVPPAATPNSGSGATTFPLLSRTYPGMSIDDDRSLLVVDQTQPDAVFYYSYSEYPRAGWPALFGYFPNQAYSPYGYFGYPYRYRPYGTYPHHRHSGRGHVRSESGWPPLPAGCGAACGVPGHGVGSGWGRSNMDMFADPPEGVRPGSRSRGVPNIGPQPPSVGPQPTAIGPRPIGPRGWRGLPSR